MAFDKSRIPANLKAAYEAGHVALLVGAGASMGANLPSWKGLLELMLKAGEDNNLVREPKSGSYRDLLKHSDKFPMVAAGLKEDLGGQFDKFMEDTFVKSKPAPTALHRAMVELDKLQFVITTNYDTLLEKSFREKDEDLRVCTYHEIGEIQRRIAEREFFILKAHGDASKAGNGLILTSVDYRTLLYRHRGYQSLLMTMFTVYTIVIVGASISDPETTLLLNYIAEVFGTSAGPNHFALMAAEDFNEVEEKRWFHDYNVQFVPVSKENNYAELTEFMVALKS